MDLGDLASGLASGGLTNIFGAVSGLIGGYLAKREARKMAQIQYNHEFKMADLQVQEAKEERAQVLALGKQNMQLAEIEGEQLIEQKETDAFIKSISDQGKLTGDATLDFILRLVRPGITFWLIYELASLQTALNELMQGLAGLPQETLIGMYVSIVDAIIFLTITAVSWWFASRIGQVKFFNKGK